MLAFSQCLELSFNEAILILKSYKNPKSAECITELILKGFTHTRRDPEKICFWVCEGIERYNSWNQKFQMEMNYERLIDQ